MAGTANAPLATSAFPTVAFSTKSNASDLSLIERLRRRAETKFSFRELFERSLGISEWHLARQMIRESSGELSEEMVDLLTCLVTK